MEQDIAPVQRDMIQAEETFEELAPAMRSMVEGAIAVATGRLHIDQPDETKRRLTGNDRAAIDYFRHEIAHQIAMLVLRTDSNVISVYKEQEVPDADESGSPDMSLSDPLGLVVYSERETAALRSLLGALDDSLVAELAGRGIHVPRGLIVATVVDPAESLRTGNRSRGFRPPPTLLAMRKDRGCRSIYDAQAL